jgi:hypothetical protein
MGNKIEIRRTILNKTDYDQVIDRSFTTFTRPVEPDTASQLNLFFKLYEDLYFEIPVEGEFNSHRYLVERSSELVTLEADQINIQPLLDEISQLREQLLEANTQIINLQSRQVR